MEEARRAAGRCREDAGLRCSEPGGAFRPGRRLGAGLGVTGHNQTPAFPGRRLSCHHLSVQAPSAGIAIGTNHCAAHLWKHTALQDGR